MAREMSVEPREASPASASVDRAPAGPPLLVDPKGTDYARYQGASIITPNKGEAERATGIQLDSPTGKNARVARSVRRLQFDAVIAVGQDVAQERFQFAARQLETGAAK